MHKHNPVPVGSMLFNAAFLKGSWRTGLIFGKPLQGLSHGFGMSFKGNAPLLLAGAALSGAMAPRGHALSESSRTLGAGIGTLIGGLVGGGAGMLIGGYIGEEIAGSAIARGVQGVADLSKHYRTINMGGEFRDSEQAYTQRQVACREMNSSLLNARQYLGKRSRLPAHLKELQCQRPTP